MSYTVLARRYRSRDFDEVVGQSAVAETLKRAVEQDRMAHAYLFCGTRGVGKTTMARIFARAMNVTSELADAEAIAEAIMRGDDLDVIEIDGASNRGVQEARDLIAGAGLSPARCPYRVYIIDEVHMLTTESFNTLLKTMEEPPAHVKFILCTTEPHKVLSTIQSRCQRFDFKPIPTRLIVQHLASIAVQEDVEIDEAALARVAELGAGSMRDALSVMDRLLAGCAGPITLSGVETSLGLPETGLVDAISEAICAGDPSAALKSGDRLLASGIGTAQALVAMTEQFRRMLVLRTCGRESDVIELDEDRRIVLHQMAAKSDPPSLVHAIAVCDSVARQGRLGASARALFDAALVRLSLAGAMQDPAQIEQPIPDSLGSLKTDAPNLVPESPSPPSGAAHADIKPSPSDASLEGVWLSVQEAATNAAIKAAFESVEVTAFDEDQVSVRATEGRVPNVVLQQLARQLTEAAGRGIKVIDISELDAVPEASSMEAGSDPRIGMAEELFDATVVNVHPGERKES